MRRIGSTCGVVMLVLAATIMASPIGGSPLSSNQAATTNEISTFHGLTNHSWYALKMFSPEAFIIEKLAFNFSVECEHSREDAGMVVITNGNDKQTFWMVSAGAIRPFNETDRFLHFEFGPINYTKQRFTFYNSSYRWSGFYQNISLGGGTWYVICLHAETVTCQIELSLTCSEMVEFQGTTGGNETFLLASHNFWGNVNFKVPGMAAVLHGEKTISIDNTFVGSWHSIATSGFELIECIRPDGTRERSIIIELGSIGGTFGDFDARFIMGDNGTWTFGLNMFVRGTEDSFPSCNLIGADVTLP